MKYPTPSTPVSANLLYDFDYKNDILRGCYEEVSAYTFYECLFSDKDIYEDSVVVTFGNNDKSSGVKANPVEKTVKTMTIEEMIESSKPYANVYVSPASFFKNYNAVACLKSLYAIVVDFDGDSKGGVSVNLLRWLIERIEENEEDLPAPTFVTNSGRGLHLFWVFEKPVPMFNHNKEVLKELYKSIHQKLTDYNAMPQRHHFAQAYRVVGSRTKLGKETLAFRTGKCLPVEELLNDFGLKNEKIVWQEGQEKKLLKPSEGMIKLAENIEKTLGVVCEKKDDWQYVHDYIQVNKDAFTKMFKLNQSKRFRRGNGSGWGTKEWYSRMKLRIITDTPEGFRYTSLMALVVIAYKCNIPLDVVEKDIDEIIIKWQMRPKSFKQTFHDEYRSRVLNMYCDKYKKVTKIQLEEWLGFTMNSSSKRNGRPQKLHLKGARAIQKINDEFNGTNWRDGNGRKSKKEIVEKWRLEHPNGRKADCIRDTGLTKPTVYKWWSA